MEKRVIPFSPPDISELEINEVAEAMRSGWITTGPRTKELEKRLAEYCHTSKVVCLNSATAAEELNFRVCGIGEGDEVIVPAYTYTASASAAIHCGAKVVFVDSQKDCVENTLQNNINHTKQCGKGSDVEQMRRMDEMVRIKDRKGIYDHTDGVDEDK